MEYVVSCGASLRVGELCAMAYRVVVLCVIGLHFASGMLMCIMGVKLRVRELGCALHGYVVIQGVALHVVRVVLHLWGLCCTL